MVAALRGSDDKENGEIFLLGKFKRFGFSEDEQSGWKAVCKCGVFCYYADGSKVVADGLFGFRVDDMGKAAAWLVDMENAEVAGRGQWFIVQRNGDLGGAALNDIGLLDADTPRVALRIVAFAMQLASDFYSIIADIEFFKFGGGFIHTKAFGNGG